VWCRAAGVLYRQQVPAGTVIVTSASGVFRGISDRLVIGPAPAKRRGGGAPTSSDHDLIPPSLSQ